MQQKLWLKTKLTCRYMNVIKCIICLLPLNVWSFFYILLIHTVFVMRVGIMVMGLDRNSK